MLYLQRGTHYEITVQNNKSIHTEIYKTDQVRLFSQEAVDFWTYRRTKRIFLCDSVKSDICEPSSRFHLNRGSRQSVIKDKFCCVLAFDSKNIQGHF